MTKIKIVIGLLLSLASWPALAQPGPGPLPDPWIVSEANIYYPNGAVKVGPSSLSSTGVGTVNVSGGFYINGVQVNGVTSATEPVLYNLGTGVVSFDYAYAGTFLAQQTAQGLTTTQPGWYAQITGDTTPRVRVGLNVQDVPSIAFGPGNATRDAFLERVGPGALRFGSNDVVAPVAQAISVQNALAGTSNAAGASATLKGSQGTGSGAGGGWIFQTAPAGSSGSSQNPLVTALMINPSGGVTVGASPAGGDEGAGKINVSGGYYINGAPIAPVSGGATGQILQGVTSSAPVWTATPTLGASGTLGTIAFGNATTGTITLQPVAGALGSSVLTMPAATDTLAVLAASQAFTNKTYNGLTVTTTTGTFTLTNAETFSVSNSLTLAGTDSTTMTFPGTSATIARTDAGQTFTGVNNFTAPVIAGGSITGLTTLALRDTSAAFDVTIAATSGTTLTAGRTLTLSMGNVAHTLALGTTANTITFPNLASFTVITNGDTGTVTNAMLAGSIAASKLTGTDIATVGTLTAGATGAGFTVALTTSTITGNLPCANTPALSGNVTTSAGSCATTIAASVVTNSMLAGSIAASKLIGTDITTVGALGAGSATTGFTIAGASVTWSSQIAGANVTVVANASGSPSATFGVMKADGTTITCSSGTCSAVGGVATAVTVGTTTVNSGTTAFLLYNNGGTLGNEAATSIAFGTGTLNLAGNLTTTGAFNPTFAIPASVTYTFPGSAANLAALNITGQTLSGGANVTPYSIGTVSSGTTTISCGNGPLQYLTNGGAFTLAAPSNDGSCLIYVLNNGSAGAITFSGFTVGSSTGDSLTTTNTSKFAISIWRINGVASYLVKALQ